MGLTLSQPMKVLSASSVKPVLGASILPIDARCSISTGVRVIDYGTQSRWQLQDVGGSQQVTPGKRTLMVSVVCPYTQTMRLSVRGDKAGNGDLRYGERGSVSLHIQNAQLDEQDVQLTKTTPDGVPGGSSVSQLRLQPGDIIAATRNGIITKGKRFTARVELTPVMAEGDSRVSARQYSEANLVLNLMD